MPIYLKQHFKRKPLRFLTNSTIRVYNGKLSHDEFVNVGINATKSKSSPESLSGELFDYQRVCLNSQSGITFRISTWSSRLVSPQAK